MAIRDPWTGQASGPAGILDVEEVRLATAALLMPHASSVKGKSGFRPGPTSPGAVTATGTPDGNVHVAPFQLFLQGGRSSAPGIYILTVDATVDINILSTPANATNPRDDLIIAQVSDTFYGDASPSKLEVKQIVGTPAASPSDPAVSGSSDYVTLARVRVPATATSINSGNITDLRTSGHAKSLVGGLHSVGVGGILPVTSSTERNALTGVYSGMTLWRADLAGLNVHQAGVWRHFVRPTNNIIATQQATTSTSYADLATVGPAVTVETDTAAKVTITSLMFNSGANVNVMSFAVSGATTVAAADTKSLQVASAPGFRLSYTTLVTGLTPGSNTFTAKYRTSAGTATFQDREITVEPC